MVDRKRALEGSMPVAPRLPAFQDPGEQTNW
jgi:hypothetical protein